jgi:hypothetical protein
MSRNSSPWASIISTTDASVPEFANQYQYQCQYQKKYSVQYETSTSTAQVQGASKVPLQFVFWITQPKFNRLSWNLAFMLSISYHFFQKKVCRFWSHGWWDRALQRQPLVFRWIVPQEKMLVDFVFLITQPKFNRLSWNSVVMLSIPCHFFQKNICWIWSLGWWEMTRQKQPLVLTVMPVICTVNCSRKKSWSVRITWNHKNRMRSQ